MAYKPKIVTGRVTGTGWPIDNHVLYFSQWDYDNHENWHLYGWDDADDLAVMLTMYHTEKEAGICVCDNAEAFAAMWQAKEWEPQGSFCLPLHQVEVVEVKQEEEPDDMRENLLAHGIDLRPRGKDEKGGILCLPLDENLNGNVQKKHPDWQPVACPHCGRKCWKPAEVDKLQQEQGLQLLCTQCALETGLVRPYRPDNTPNPAGNRAQRRRAKHGKKRS